MEDRKPEKREQRATPPTGSKGPPQGWPAGTTSADRVCWVCGGPTEYRHCKIICSNCGFTRDCSDP